MLVVQNYSIAVLLCFLAMLCWGSWQNTQNLAGKNWRFELFYWDFVTGILLLSLLAAFTVGSTGDTGRTFLEDVRQANGSSIASAMLGGAIWNLGTLLLVAAIAIAGMAVAFPIGGGIGWILGIVINYVGNPEGNPVFLFGGASVIALAILLSMNSYKKLASQQQKPTFRGIALSIAAGLAIAFFYRFVAASLATDYTAAEAGKLTPYTAVVFFSLGAFLSTFLFNPFFMRNPIQGPPVSFSDYSRANLKTHLIGILGGIIWCFGMVFSFMAVHAASPAIAYGLSNSAPVVAALWGIFVWKEFSGAPKGTNMVLTMMFICYLVGLGLIVYSRFA